MCAAPWGVPGRRTGGPQWRSSARPTVPPMRPWSRDSPELRTQICGRAEGDLSKEPAPSVCWVTPHGQIAVTCREQVTRPRVAWEQITVENRTESGPATAAATARSRSRRRRRHHPAAVSRIAVATTSIAATVLTMAGLAANANAEEANAPVPAPAAVYGPRPAATPSAATASSPRTHTHTHAS